MTLQWFAQHITEFILTAICGGFVVYIKKLHKHYTAMAEGTQALLRESIINSYRYYKDKGYCDPEERIVLGKTYHAYRDLGGNDVASDLYKRILALPTKEEEK